MQTTPFCVLIITFLAIVLLPQERYVEFTFIYSEEKSLVSNFDKFHNLFSMSLDLAVPP